MFGRHEEVARLGWVVRRLLSDVVALCAVWIVPIAGEDLAQNGVQRLFDTSTRTNQRLRRGDEDCEIVRTEV